VTSATRSTLTLLWLSVPLGACGSGTGEDLRGPLRVEREERGDTTIVRTLRGSVWGDTATLVAEVVIGELDGAPAYVFGQIAGLELDPVGRLLVVDQSERELRIFDTGGTHLLTVGRRGSGPGEFQRPDYVRATRDGRIVVRDQPFRFSVFSHDGTHLSSWLLGTGYSTSDPFFLDPQDRVLNPSSFDHLVRYELDGRSLDTIPIPRGGYTPPQLEVVGDRMRATYSIPFMPREWWRLTSDGRTLFGMTGRYALDRWEPSGRIFRIERHVEPVAVQPAEGDQAHEQITLNIRRNNAPGWRWNGPGIPAVKPPIRGVFPGRDGSIWVIRSVHAVERPDPDYEPERGNSFPTEWYEPQVADVFDAGGNYLGPVKLPENLRLYPMPVFTTEGVVASATHEIGYHQIVRYRLVKPGAH